VKCAQRRPALVTFIVTFDHECAGLFVCVGQPFALVNGKITCMMPA